MKFSLEILSWQCKGYSCVFVEILCVYRVLQLIIDSWITNYLQIWLCQSHHVISMDFATSRSRARFQLVFMVPTGKEIIAGRNDGYQSSIRIAAKRRALHQLDNYPATNAVSATTIYHILRMNCCMAKAKYFYCAIVVWRGFLYENLSEHCANWINPSLRAISENALLVIRDFKQTMHLYYKTQGEL